MSSTISAIAYDDSGAVLGVRFNSGGEYRYRSVPRRVYEGFLNASSKGSYFDQFVRKAGYAYLRVT
jgi:KTSC domain